MFKRCFSNRSAPIADSTPTKTQQNSQFTQTDSHQLMKKRQAKQVDKSSQAMSSDPEIKQSFKKYLSSVESLQCSICMDLIVSCRTAVCGHSFCEECITESLLRKRECPICRKDIRQWVLNKNEIIDTAVTLMVN
jgi:hypothetical protein